MTGPMTTRSRNPDYLAESAAEVLPPLPSMRNEPDAGLHHLGMRPPLVGISWYRVINTSETGQLSPPVYSQHESHCILRSQHREFSDS